MHELREHCPNTQTRRLIFLGVDEIRNDGFYSAALLQFSGNGKFPLKIRATSKEGDKTQLVVGGGTLSAYQPDGGR